MLMNYDLLHKNATEFHPYLPASVTREEKLRLVFENLIKSPFKHFNNRVFITFFLNDVLFYVCPLPLLRLQTGI